MWGSNVLPLFLSLDPPLRPSIFIEMRDSLRRKQGRWLQCQWHHLRHENWKKDGQKETDRGMEREGGHLPTPHSLSLFLFLSICLLSLSILLSTLIRGGTSKEEREGEVNSNHVIIASKERRKDRQREAFARGP